MANFLIDNGAGAVSDDESLKERQRARLRQMTFYCYSRYCLRGEILRYFGQRLSGSCGNCSVCCPQEQKASPIKMLAKREEGKRLEEELALDTAVLKRLKEARLTLARRQGVPAFVVFTDATLREICVRMPRTEEELMRVPGIGTRKCQQYGQEVLKVLLEQTQ